MLLSLFVIVTIVSCKKEIDLQSKDKKTTEISYSEVTEDTTTTGTKATPFQKLDLAIWSMGNLEEYIQDKLSKATTKTQGNEIYEEYRENIESRIETINELEGDFLANYANYYEHENDRYVFPDSIQKRVDLLKGTDLELWEVGEGYAEIRFKPYHYYSMFKGKVTDDYEYYLRTEAKENTVLYSADAGLLISFEDLGTRVLSWEKFITDYPKSALLERAVKKYQEYGYIYLMGLENTTTFDYENGSLEDDSKKEFKRFIAKNPNSNFAQIIKRLLAKVKENASYEELEEFTQKELNIVVEKEPDTP